LESAGVAARPASVGRRRAGVGAALGRARERLRTTPGRLVLTSIVVVAGLACFGIVATIAEQSREGVVRTARTATEPLLRQSGNLYTALSDANATVVTGLLAGGLEPAEKRARYVSDLRVATGVLTALSRQARPSPAAAAALGTVAVQVPLYSGLVETARANNRQGFPVGAAYLRQAAQLMDTHILPAAKALYVTEATRLGDDYRTGTATSTVIALIAASALALAVLLFAQWYLTRISRRILNPLLVAATVAWTAVSVWAIVGLVSEQNALATAQRKGSDTVEVLSAANVLLSRAQGDFSLALVNRGTDEADLADFKAVMPVLAAPLLANRLGGSFAAYRASTEHINKLEGAGELQIAIRLAPGAGTLAERMSTGLRVQTDTAQDRFTNAAGDAASALGGLWLAIPVVTILAATLAVLGLRRRINEYR
jgi:hypothetical protein